MKRLFAICIALAFFASFSRAASQVTAAGNNNIICQFYPQMALGNQIACPKQTPYPSPFPNATSATVTNGPSLTGTRNEQITVADPNTNPVVFLWWATGTTRSPNVQTYGMYTGTSGTATAVGLVAGNVTVTCSTSNHDQPGGGDIGFGYVVEEFCANDNGHTCLSSTTPLAAGSNYHCMILDFCSTVGGGVANVDCSANTSLHIAPVLNMSEVSCSSWGPIGTFPGLPNAGTPGYTIPFQCGGQQFSPNTNFTMVAGYETFTAYAVFNSSFVLQHVYMDTACSQGGAIVQTVDVMANTGNTDNTDCNATEQPTVAWHTNVFQTIDFTADTAGTGTITETLPNWNGSCGGTTYTWPGPTTGTAATDASSFVTGFNGGGLATSGCYKAGLCSNTTCPDASVCHNTSCAVIICLSNCVSVDASGTVSAVFNAGTGALTLTSNAFNTKTAAGQNGSAHYGLGPYNWWGWQYHLLGESNTFTYLSGGLQANSYNSFYAMIACPPADPVTGNAEPIAGIWTCYDWTRGADGFSFTYGPNDPSNTSTTHRLLPMGVTPACSPTDCSATINMVVANNGSTVVCHICLPNMPSAAQPTGWVPFVFNGDVQTFATSSISTPSTTTDIGEFVAPNGDLWLAWACGDTSNTTFALCWSEWPVGGTSATNITGSLTGVIGGFADRNFSTNINGYWNNINLSVDEQHNTVKIIVATSDAGVISKCGAITGTCVGVYTSTNINAVSGSGSGATFTFAKKSTNFASSGNTASAECQNSQDQFALHTLMLCAPGASTDGSANMWFLDVNP